MLYPKQALIHYQNVFFGLSKEFEKHEDKESQNSDDDMVEDERSKSGSVERLKSPTSHEEEHLPAPNFNFKAQDEWVTIDPREQSVPTFNRWDVDEYDQRHTDSWRPEHKPSPRVQSQLNFKLQFGEIGRSNTKVAKASGKSYDEKRKILRQIEVGFCNKYILYILIH